MARDERCDGDVLDTRLAFFRRTLKTGNGDSGDLLRSFSAKQRVGYKGVVVTMFENIEIRYLNSPLRVSW